MRRWTRERIRASGAQEFMADYYDVLYRAVTALEPNTREQRQQLYERARRTVSDRLRSLDPPIPPAEIDAALSTVDSAIERVEREIAERVSPPSPIWPSPPAATADDEAEERIQTLLPARPARHPALALAIIGLIAIIGVAVYAYRPRSIAVSLPPPERVGSVQSEPAYVFKRQPVYYRTTHPVGSIVVETSQHFLYFVRPNLVAVRYGIAVGRECRDLAGLFRISQKEETVAAIAPASDLMAAESRPRKTGVADGFTEPILYLSDTSARIHVVQTPSAIGRTVASGCIQLAPSDVVDLYQRVSSGARVIIAN
jgi:lipoprotein-anchoring transpeptidase ErfK/SrfK